MRALLHTDGGARGNPGPAAIGIVLEFPGMDRDAVEISDLIGTATNNVAEYAAVLRGLREARARGATSADCVLDSELVVRQLTGMYRVRDARLRELAREVAEVEKLFRVVNYVAVPREENRRADALVNRALDHLP